MGGPGIRAIADNFSFEARVAPTRAANFHAEIGAWIAATDVDDLVGELQAAHGRYRANKLRVNHRDEVPESFQKDNHALTQALRFGADTQLVRIERIDRILASGATFKSFADLSQAFKTASTALPRTAPQAMLETRREAQAKLNSFIAIWNSQRGREPLFAGLLEDVEPDADAPDWPERLRLRFGLGHIDKATLVKMRYTIRDVLAARGKAHHSLLCADGVGRGSQPPFLWNSNRLSGRSGDGVGCRERRGGCMFRNYSRSHGLSGQACA